MELRSKSEMPPIHEIYGQLEGVAVEDDASTGYIVIAYNKSNRAAMLSVARELEQLEGRDVYIQVRQMTKRDGTT